MRLFGLPKRTSWEVASNEIATAFLDLRKEFYERCLEALDWNISKRIMGAPRSRKVLSGYAELGVMAFQMSSRQNIVCRMRLSRREDRRDAFPRLRAASVRRR
jgi:hypothetical protein